MRVEWGNYRRTASSEDYSIGMIDMIQKFWYKRDVVTAFEVAAPVRDSRQDYNDVFFTETGELVPEVVYYLVKNDGYMAYIGQERVRRIQQFNKLWRKE